MSKTNLTAANCSAASPFGYILLLLSGAFWGSGGYWITKMTATGAGPSATAFTGHFFALPFLAILIYARHGKAGFRMSAKGILYCALLGILTKGVFKLTYDTTVTLVGVAMGSILLYLAPVFTAVMSVLLFKEKLTAQKIIALALNFVGCALVVTGGNFTELNISGLGLLLGVISGFLYALNTVLGKLTTGLNSPLTAAFYMLVFSSLTTGLSSGVWQQAGYFIRGDFMLWALINSIFTGFLANVCFFEGLALGVDASKATILASVEVIVATLTGILFLSEVINWVGIIGIVIMFASIILMNIKLSSANRKPTAGF